MTIRNMRKSDEAEVGRLYVRSWQEGYKGLLPQDYLDGLDSWRWKETPAQGASMSVGASRRPRTS